MYVGVPKEIRPQETRVACTPDATKKLAKKGLKVRVESGAGVLAGFSNEDYLQAGAEIGETKSQVFSSDLVLKVHRPTDDEIPLFKKGAFLVSHVEPHRAEDFLAKLAAAHVNVLAMELIPRTTRAQSMDALSSQANIAGYRAVLEAASRYRRFMAMMMTSAGMAKPARVLVLGAGVAGLQAIATAKRLGGSVEAFDVRAEVKEQIISLGAKFLEIDLGEEGSGAGGYAKELSEAAKLKQIQVLNERIKKFDIVISTANIPGRRAPVLITEDAVKGMRTGSVIVDMAAANGGNCPLTEVDQVVEKFGVTLIGLTNFPALVPADASNFYANNVLHLLNLFLNEKEGTVSLKANLEDDIVAASLATFDGQVRFQKKG